MGDIYDLAIHARRNREVADVDGVSYVVPTRGYNWFHWKGCRWSGQWIHGAAVNIIEKMLTAREILLGRHYLPGSIKHYELVEG